MSIFDFVKDAGEAILGKMGLDKESDIEEMKNRVSRADIKVSNLMIDIDDDIASISGEAKSQMDREKAVLVAGNTRGIAQVNDRLSVPTSEPEARFYDVVAGDSLSRIARNLYGDANKYPVIFKANQPMLESPDRIYPGQSLRIPPL